MNFFMDLWHDLREKRLWPVAVGLIAAIVAVPAILFKPASDAAPPASVPPKAASADTLPVVAVESGPSVGSKLEAFDEKNPFKPMKDLAKAQTGGSGAGAGSGSASGSGSGSGATSPGTGGFGGGTGSDTGSGSDPASGGTPSGGSPSGGSPSGGSPSDPSPNTRWFHYTADFSFGAPGKPKSFKNIGSFTLLPDENTPAIVFVGIDSDHKSAMFFISDPAFEAQGEGECNASGDACRFVTLKLGDTNDEETFTASDGSVSYDLKLLKINREELGTGSSPDPTPAGKSAKGIGATGAGVASATQTTQSVLPEVFSVGPGVGLEQK
jgi:hypothetical protein